MDGVLVEHAAGVPRVTLWRSRDPLVCRRGYRWRAELQADGYRRLIGLFLFNTPAATTEALDETAAQDRADPRPRPGPALLVREDVGAVVFLRRPAGDTA